MPTDSVQDVKGLWTSSRNDPRVKSFAGDNRRLVESNHHLDVVHNRRGISYKATGIRGGAYNLRFQEEILVMPDGYRDATVGQILAIRDKLIIEFGL